MNKSESQARRGPTPKSESEPPQDDLRQLARARLAGEVSPPTDEQFEQRHDRVVHELAVHQIELEMQNEQLRQAQLALEASRDRYADLYEKAPVGYVTLTPLGAIVAANRMAVDMLGSPEPQLVGRSFESFVALEDQAAFLQHRRTLLTEKVASKPIDVRLEVPRRALRWVRLDMVAVHARERASEWHVAMTDITDRVRLQHDLSRLAAVVASSEDAIVSLDIEGRVTSWNDAATRLFGPGTDAMLGNTLDALVPDERLGEEQERLYRLMRGERVEHFETEWRNREGVALALSITLSPVLDRLGALAGASLIARDIGDRQRTDTALRMRLRQLDALSHAGQALILGKSDAVPMQQELFERVAEAVGSQVQLVYAIAGEPGALTLQSARGLAPAQLERLRTKPLDDSLCGLVVEQRHHLVLNHLQSSALPQARLLQQAGVRCFAGFPLIVRGQVHGVAAFGCTTRERFHEGDLQVMQTVCDQASAMLERTQLLDDLHAREQSLKRADRAKDEFIATLAHELRNPLAPIRNAVGIMRHEDDRMTQQLAWCRDIIDRQVGQMTHLLEDLLDVSRVTRNKIELRRDRIDLRLAIEQAIEVTRPLIESQQQRLQIEMPPEPIMLYGDLTRLTQVFGNLLNNAAKYTDADGRILLTVTLQDGSVRLSVRDSGIGIETQQLPRVFDMFSQLAPALERARGGLGIGLALTRGLVELHGGTIEAFSAGVGQGSEFVVQLPVTPPARPKESGLASDESPVETRSTHRLLVVDDNVDAAQTLGAILELNGHDVRVAYSGAEGLRIAAEWQPDVGLLDIGIPDLNGYELARAIRERCLDRPPLLIACTGWGQQEDIERAREAGFDHHLVKPVDPDAVLRLLPRASQADG